MKLLLGKLIVKGSPPFPCKTLYTKALHQAFMGLEQHEHDFSFTK